MSKNSTSITVSQAKPADVSRVERFQALQAGQYWKVQHKIAKQGIAEGEVLLIKSIRWVDDAPHTIILRPHPRNIGEHFEVKEKDSSGHTITRYVAYEEHRFLLKEFLSLFEYEPDHQRVRSEELKQIQNKVTELQTELLESQSNPQRMALIVDEGLKQQAKEEGKESSAKESATAALPAVRQEVVSLATGSVANAIEAGLTEEGIAHIKAMANREHRIATVKAKWIQGKTEAIAETIQAMTPFYEEQAAAALAATEDVRTYVQKLSQGIESLDLYVGKGVEVGTIRNGASAPREEPLTFMQKKLLMDEEFAVWADVDERFDFEKESAFFEALAKHDSLVNQIFPTQRAVVVMAVTRRELDYGDRWTNVTKNNENRKVFLLIRDGENIHRVFSPVESHLGAARLFPTTDDQDQIFRGYDGSQIKFDDVAFTDKLAVHEQHALHFKRFLLLACGLDHRLKLFGEFYDGPQSMQFVSMQFQEQYCRFLHDDADTGRILGEGRPTLKEWLKEKNAYLRSGSRVLCNWRELMNPTTAPAACKARRERAYDRFDRWYTANTPMEVKIAYREGASLCVDVEVSGDLRRSYGTREFTCKVNLSKFRDGYWSNVDLPFLCLDTVEPADLHWYIHNRETRSDHLSYIRFFKRALAFITAERQTEKATRDRLAQALEEGKIAAGAQAQELVSQAIVAWRAANRGKALPQFDGSENNAEWKSLLDQMYVLVRTGKSQIAEVEDFLKERGLTPLRLVLNGSAKLMVYAAPAASERDDRLLPHCWAHCFTLEHGKRKLKERSHRWALLPEQAASETTLQEWPDAADWAMDKSVFASLDRKQALLKEPSKFKDRVSQYLRMDEGEYAKHLKEWLRVRSEYLHKGRSVSNPRPAIPIGMVYRHKQLRFVCVAPVQMHALLHRLAPSEEARSQLRDRFISVYADKSAGASWHDEALSRSADWTLLEISASAKVGDSGYLPSDAGYERLGAKPPCDPRLATWLERWRQDVQDHAKVWLAPELFNAAGECILDQILGVTLPEDYEPLNVVEVKVHSVSEEGEGEMPKYPHWFDISKRTQAEEEGSSNIDVSDRRAKRAVPKEYNCSSRYHIERSRADARELVEYEAKKEGLRAVRDKDLPDAVRAPKGFERWYLIDADSSK